MTRSPAVALGLAVVAFLLTTGSARAQTLWQSTKIGMSVGDVRALYPDARQGSGRTVGGVSEELKIADYAVLDRRFGVGFWFDGGRLVRVVLDAADLDRAGTAANLATWARLVALLGDKYGGSSCQTAKSATLLQSCEWTTPAAKIDLLYVDLGDRPILLDIYYEARRPADERERL